MEAQKPRDDWYPRITQVERTPVGVFQQEFAQLNNDETRVEARTMIGTMMLPT